MDLIDYLNPFSLRFHSYNKFCEIQFIDQKIKIIAVAIIFTVLTIPILGLGGIVAFRLMVKWYTHTKNDEKKEETRKIPELAIPLLNSDESRPSLHIETHFPEILIPIIQLEKKPRIEEPKAPTRSVLTKQRTRTYSVDERDKIATFSSETLKKFVTDLRLDEVETFWKQECESAAAATSRESQEKVISRLGAILDAISEENFKKSVEFNNFWTILNKDPYYPILTERLQPKHLQEMTQRVREMLITGDPLFLENYISHEKILKNLISRILNSKKELMGEYLSLICPHATPNLQLELDIKVRRLPATKRKEVEASLKQAVNSFPKGDRRSLPSPIKLKAAANPARRWSAPAPQPRPEPESFEEIKKYSSPLTNEAGEKYFDQFTELNQVPLQDQENLFFWILKNIAEPNLNQKKQFAKDYFSQFANPQEYIRLEKIHDKELKNLIQLLDIKELFILWNQEKCAASKYFGPRERQRLENRLKVELSALSKSQLTESLKIDIFWTLMTTIDYKKTFAESLNAEHFGWFAEWARISKKVGVQNDFCAFLNLLPKDTLEQRNKLKAIALAILPYIFRDLKPKTGQHEIDQENLDQFKIDQMIADKLRVMLGVNWINKEITTLRENEKKLELLQVSESKMMVKAEPIENPVLKIEKETDLILEEISMMEADVEKEEEQMVTELVGEALNRIVAFQSSLQIESDIETDELIDKELAIMQTEVDDVSCEMVQESVMAALQTIKALQLITFETGPIYEEDQFVELLSPELLQSAY